MGAVAYAGRMGLQAGQTVREIGWDDDTDPELRDDVRQATGSALLDENEDDGVAVDVVLYWWRSGDGDLASALEYDLGPWSEGGTVWVLTPRTGKPGHESVDDIAEAAAGAGLRHTGSVALGGWVGHRIGRTPAAS
ncbi:MULTISPECIES: DUF3052 domain-containing protein [Streptomyces]|uniref:DUF3052 domain-containing protein n=2 Tax=Streptomyces TaxID=1883 RepID=A0ABU4K770_9ACTN|nr:DUF3052 domain-containing protein [Streptomyces roseolus]MDX2293601.1 DUF3052 domain-containing protein [Streptomyces roseolus]